MRVVPACARPPETEAQAEACGPRRHAGGRAATLRKGAIRRGRAVLSVDGFGSVSPWAARRFGLQASACGSVCWISGFVWRAGGFVAWAGVLAFGAVLGFAQQPVHELCKPCHSEITADFLSHPHAKAALSCDTCHGASVRHRESGGGADPDRVAAPDEVPALCGACHDHAVANASGPATTLLSQYNSSKHGVFVAERSKVRAPHCATCHGEHRLRTARAIQLSCTRCHDQLPQACSGAAPSQASAVRCANCHRPHGFAVPERR